MTDTTTETPTVAMTDRMRLVLDARSKLIRRRTVGRSPGAAEIAKVGGWTTVWVSKALRELAEAGLLGDPPREGPQGAAGGPGEPRPPERRCRAVRAAERATADARRAEMKAETEKLANAAKARREKDAADARRRGAELAADRARERAEAREARERAKAEAAARSAAGGARWVDVPAGFGAPDWARRRGSANVPGAAPVAINLRVRAKVARWPVPPGYGARAAKQPRRWTEEDRAVWEARPEALKRVGDMIPGTSVMALRTPTGIDGGWTLAGELGLGINEGDDE
jgi:hypothetical protein